MHKISRSNFLLAILNVLTVTVSFFVLLYIFQDKKTLI